MRKHTYNALMCAESGYEHPLVALRTKFALLSGCSAPDDYGFEVVSSDNKLYDKDYTQLWLEMDIMHCKGLTDWLMVREGLEEDLKYLLSNVCKGSKPVLTWTPFVCNGVQTVGIKMKWYWKDFQQGPGQLHVIPLFEQVWHILTTWDETDLD